MAGRDANIFTTLVRAEGLFRRWLPFGGKLLNGKLPSRDREILILRTAWNCKAEYEWAQHVLIARRVGLSDDEIELLNSTRTTVAEAGSAPRSWRPFDTTLVRAADELHDEMCISDATWDELSHAYDTAQLIEVPMLVGHYHLVAMTLNTLGVELDDGLPRFAR